MGVRLVQWPRQRAPRPQMQQQPRAEQPVEHGRCNNPAQTDSQIRRRTLAKGQSVCCFSCPLHALYGLYIHVLALVLALPSSSPGSSSRSDRVHALAMPSRSPLPSPSPSSSCCPRPHPVQALAPSTLSRCPRPHLVQALALPMPSPCPSPHPALSLFKLSPCPRPRPVRARALPEPLPCPRPCLVHALARPHPLSLLLALLSSGYYTPATSVDTRLGELGSPPSRAATTWPQTAVLCTSRSRRVLARVRAHPPQRHNRPYSPHETGARSLRAIQACLPVLARCGRTFM